ncbi:hypothetical protein V8E52_000176 [Russula decolorans]
MKDRIASNPLSKKGFLGQVCVTEHILCRQDSPPHGLRVLGILAAHEWTILSSQLGIHGTHVPQLQELAQLWFSRYRCRQTRAHTTPGFRLLKKYGMYGMFVDRIGSSRFDLSSMIVLKDHYIWLCMHNKDEIIQAIGAGFDTITLEGNELNPVTQCLSERFLLETGSGVAKLKVTCTSVPPLNSKKILHTFERFTCDQTFPGPHPGD